MQYDVEGMEKTARIKTYAEEQVMRRIQVGALAIKGFWVVLGTLCAGIIAAALWVGYVNDRLTTNHNAIKILWHKVFDNELP